MARSAKTSMLLETWINQKQFLWRIKLFLISSDKYRRQLYYLYRQVWFLFVSFITWDWKTNQNLFQSMPPKPRCLRLMCIKLFWGHLRKRMTHLCLSFYLFHLQTCAQQFLNLLLFRHYFFPCPQSAARSAVCLWWNECFTNQYKPGQWQQQLKSYTLRAPNGLTLQFPPQREIGRTEVGIMKTTSVGKSGPFFTQHWLPPLIPQTRPFSPGVLPSSAPVKMEACFPSINCCTHSFAFEEHYIMQQFPFQHVLAHKFVHFVCESEDVNTQVGARSLLPNHWQMCNGFPVILLP